jgi:Na+-driven multidrug efflux pump
MVCSVVILVVVVVASFGTATMILTGEAKGKNDRDQYSQVVKSAYGLSALVAFVMLIICFINPERILSLFTKDTYIIETSGYLLILICVNLFGKSANIICGSGIKGSGDTKWMLYTQVFGTVLVVTCAWIMVYVFKLGILGVFVAVMIDEGLRAIINFGKFGKVVKCWN